MVDSDQILGSQEDVFIFVKSACEKLNCSLIDKKKGKWLLPSIPAFLQSSLGEKPLLLTFVHPAPEGIEYIGRNHPLVEALARHILEDALVNQDNPIAARCGYTVTDAVEKRTTLLLVRLRHLLRSTKNQTLLAEECAVIGFTGAPSQPKWLEPEIANELLKQAEAVSNTPKELKQEEISELLEDIKVLEGDLEDFAALRSQTLSQSHRRVRTITKEGAIQVKPQLPMDILGIFILQPGKRKT
ncbi:hypothetical protein DSM106972_066990 [Dulcicalothrix desertica PCC 7102]|uniref:Uncharacterized protein n=1 Tax=Dulcicalothrix desertica PCC 7102 TaxID=232991 RepID=A0A433V671_9CYAN|nr:hypothetical protein DSM106972_066990 [Dulcicalothrix desertica PCC 7102]